MLNAIISALMLFSLMVASTAVIAVISPMLATCWIIIAIPLLFASTVKFLS